MSAGEERSLENSWNPLLELGKDRWISLLFSLRMHTSNLSLEISGVVHK